MQGSEETDLASQKDALLASQQKIIEFPIEICENKFSFSKKNNNKNKITSIRRMTRFVNISKKMDFFAFNLRNQSSALLKKENLIFLVTFRRNNFRHKFLQKFLYRWDIKMAHSVRMHWASNSPRYLSTKRD